jgi:hypothetical protein
MGVQLFGTQHVATLGDLETSQRRFENVVGNFWSIGAAVVFRWTADTARVARSGDPVSLRWRSASTPGHGRLSSAGRGTSPVPIPSDRSRRRSFSDRAG